MVLNGLVSDEPYFVARVKPIPEVKPEDYEQGF